MRVIVCVRLHSLRLPRCTTLTRPCPVFCAVDQASRLPLPLPGGERAFDPPPGRYPDPDRTRDILEDVLKRSLQVRPPCLPIQLFFRTNLAAFQPRISSIDIPPSPPFLDTR